MTGNKKENGDPTGGTFHVPSNEAGKMPRFFRDARNGFRFPEKSVHNKSPLSIPTYTDPSRGPETRKTTKEVKQTVTEKTDYMGRPA